MFTNLRVLVVLIVFTFLGGSLCFAGIAVGLQVEACIVEVSSANIYADGQVKKLDSIPITKVLWALREGGGGEILNCMKIVLLSGQEASVASNSEHSEKVARSEEEKGEDIVTEVESSTSFHVQAEKMESSEIALKFNFDQVIEKEEKVENAKQNKGEHIETEAEVNRHWSGGTVIKAGKSIIAGLTQNEETVVFLILSADFIK